MHLSLFQYVTSKFSNKKSGLISANYRGRVKRFLWINKASYRKLPLVLAFFKRKCQNQWQFATKKSQPAEYKPLINLFQLISTQTTI